MDTSWKQMLIFVLFICSFADKWNAVEHGPVSGYESGEGHQAPHQHHRWSARVQIPVWRNLHSLRHGKPPRLRAQGSRICISRRGRITHTHTLSVVLICPNLHETGSSLMWESLGFIDSTRRPKFRVILVMRPRVEEGEIFSIQAAGVFKTSTSSAPAWASVYYSARCALTSGCEQTTDVLPPESTLLEW